MCLAAHYRITSNTQALHTPKCFVNKTVFGQGMSTAFTANSAVLSCQAINFKATGETATVRRRV